VLLYQVVGKLKGLIVCLDDHSGPFLEKIQVSFTNHLKEYYSGLSNLVQMVEETIDLEVADNHEYLIKSDFHPELASIRTKMLEMESEMNRLATVAAMDLGLEFGKKLKFENNSQYGYILRVSRVEANSAGLGKGKLKGIIELNVQKSGVIFSYFMLICSYTRSSYCK
jgi:DNA mismatch repair protein MSH2